MRASAETMPDVTVWADAEGIAYRQHEVADLEVVGIPQHRRLERFAVEFGPEQGQVAALVRDQHPRRELPPVGQYDLDRAGLFDDVVVGHDQAVRADDHAGAERVLRTLAAPLAEIEKAAEERVV